MTKVSVEEVTTYLGSLKTIYTIYGEITNKENRNLCVPTRPLPLVVSSKSPADLTIQLL